MVEPSDRRSSPIAIDKSRTIEFNPELEPSAAEHSFDIEFTGAERLVAGKYALLERVGEGGMGIVWLAEQQAPVTRKVAIKFLRPERFSSHIAARFAIEFRALAHMNHPHIASVFDGGRAENGLPFIVMEFVHGLPLTAYCDRERCTIEQRLGVFEKLCLAVEHAHQRGIIHRDLKPSNILVAEDGDSCSPKVIDFGLAKTLPWSECSAEAPTHPGAVVGTPAYMAPEQIMSGDQAIDTRADVYALGVILYQLVTGTLPFSASSEREGGWLETYRQVLHEEPERPSDRLRVVQDGSETAENRQSDASRLRRTLRGDLDWIILKCLGKSPETRYASVTELRLDLGRFLANQPTEAHPPSTAYRVRKFVRRHKLAVVSTAMVVIAIVGGLIGTTWGLVRANIAESELRFALKNESESKQQAQRALSALAESIIPSSRDEPSEEAELFRQIARLHDANAAASHSHLDDISGQLVRPGASPQERKYRQIVTVLEHLVQERPTIAHRVILANVRFRLANSLAEAGQRREAEKEYLCCRSAFEALAAEQPSESSHREQANRIANQIERLNGER